MQHQGVPQAGAGRGQVGGSGAEALGQGDLLLQQLAGVALFGRVAQLLAAALALLAHQGRPTTAEQGRQHGSDQQQLHQGEAGRGVRAVQLA